MTKQNWYILIGVIVAVILLVVLAFLIGRGCVGDQETDTTPTTPTTTTRTTPTTPTTRTVTVTVPTTPTPPPTPPVPPPDIISRSVNPEVVDPGNPLTFQAQITGTAVSVTMSVYKSDSGALALSLPLVQGATVGDVTTWSAGTSAPAAKGVYRYYASAVGQDGTVVEMPGVSGWTFCVGDPMVDCS